MSINPVGFVGSVLAVTTAAGNAHRQAGTQDGLWDPKGYDSANYTQAVEVRSYAHIDVAESFFTCG